MSTGSPGEPRRDRDRRTRILVRQVFFLFFFCHSHDAWGLRSVSTEVMSCVRSFSFEFQVRAPTGEGQGRARGTQGPPGGDQANPSPPNLLEICNPFPKVHCLFIFCVMPCYGSFSFEFQVTAPTWEGQGHPGARGETRFVPAPPIPVLQYGRCSV